MRTSESVTTIAGALLKAQKAMGAAKKDAKNPHFKSTYADLSSVIEAVKGPLNDNGIFYGQEPTTLDGAVAVTTRLQHVSGEWMEFGPLAIPLERANAHGVGSATTYAKRYALAAACGLPTEDDDGNEATKPSTKPTGVTAERRIDLPAGAVQILSSQPKRKGNFEWAEITVIDSDGVEATYPVKGDPRGGSAAVCEQLCQSSVPVVLTLKDGKRGPVVEAIAAYDDNAALDSEVAQQDQEVGAF